MSLKYFIGIIMQKQTIININQQKLLNINVARANALTHNAWNNNMTF